MTPNLIKIWLRESVLGLVDFLYPIGCAGCSVTGQGYLCRECAKKIIYIDEPYCHHCGVPIEEGRFNYCPRCAFDFGFHNGGMSIAIYDEPVSSLIHQLKYQRETGIAKFLASLTIERIMKIDMLDDLKCDIIHPVPLHQKRKSIRGFNQSSLIAKHLSLTMGIPFNEDLIIRIKDTKSQTGLSYDERISNVRNSFEVKELEFVKDKSILLFDDVMTTGATIQECARVLKNAGAGNVKFLSIARQILED